MSIGEAVVLGYIISAFVVFAATLAWISHYDRPVGAPRQHHWRIGLGSLRHSH